MFKEKLEQLLQQLKDETEGLSFDKEEDVDYTSDTLMKSSSAKLKADLAISKLIAQEVFGTDDSKVIFNVYDCFVRDKYITSYVESAKKRYGGSTTQSARKLADSLFPPSGKGGSGGIFN